MSQAHATHGYTYDDLAGFPDDNLRREIIGGELVVTPAPEPAHQDAVLLLGARLLAWTEQHGGKVYVAPLDVHFAHDDVVEPDVVFLRPEHVDQVGAQYVKDAPDLVVEVSSPSTRRLELVRKRDLYERYGVAEYWYVDRDADRIEIYRLGDDGRYGTPALVARGQQLTTPLVPGFQVAVDGVLGAPPAG